MQSISISMWETWKENVDNINYIAQLKFIWIKIKVAEKHTSKEIEKLLLTYTCFPKQRNLFKIEILCTSLCIYI